MVFGPLSHLLGLSHFHRVGPTGPRTDHWIPISFRPIAYRSTRASAFCLVPTARQEAHRREGRWHGKGLAETLCRISPDH